MKEEISPLCQPAASLQSFRHGNAFVLLKLQHAEALSPA